ncbi:tail assembly chaperone [Mycobacterium phage Yuna]|uniref:Tail assembly chaperone n=1 Tax=Mycobacterium phage Yuna TaxID=2599885 RepID=A0A5J6TEW3_9CAUD|nr:tail assembly chaperone [Mycobacterium phage Yuna]QFG09401.1 tail assembly chaperone [Mycobacterium phage Yuna]
MATKTKTAAVVDDQDVETVEPVEAPESTREAIVDEWADEYDEGTELFVGSFDAEDFDPDYGVAEFPEGTTIAVKRCLRKPPPGWIRQHAHLSDLERTFALIEMHACDRALEILDSLDEKPWDQFVTAWGKDGGLIEGKSRRSVRRRAR